MQKRKNRDMIVLATKFTTPYRSWELGAGKDVNYSGNSKRSLHVSVEIGWTRDYDIMDEAGKNSFFEWRNLGSSKAGPSHHHCSIETAPRRPLV